MLLGCVYVVYTHSPVSVFSCGEKQHIYRFLLWLQSNKLVLRQRENIANQQYMNVWKKTREEEVLFSPLFRMEMEDVFANIPTILYRNYYVVFCGWYSVVRLVNFTEQKRDIRKEFHWTKSKINYHLIPGRWFLINKNNCWVEATPHYIERVYSLSM